MAHALQMTGHLAAAIPGQSMNSWSITAINASVAPFSGTGAYNTLTG
jgi:hypothetical protein